MFESEGMKPSTSWQSLYNSAWLKVLWAARGAKARIVTSSQLNIRQLELRSLLFIAKTLYVEMV